MLEEPRAISTWVKHVLAREALTDVLAALDAESIPCVAVKGIVLAQRLYADVAERPLQDVDLRVRPADFAKLPAIAARHRWPLDWSSRQLGAVGFVHDKALVELETTVGPPGLCALPVAELLARAEPCAIAGGPTCLAPELHDHAVLLVVNVFKDKIVRCPRWSVEDLARIVELRDFDVETFLSRVARGRARTMTAVVAEWLARERGSAAWADVRDRLGRPSRAWYARAYAVAVRRAPESLAARVLTRLGADRRADRVYSIASGAAGAAIARFRAGRSWVNG